MHLLAFSVWAKWIRWTSGRNRTEILAEKRGQFLNQTWVEPFPSILWQFLSACQTGAKIYSRLPSQRTFSVTNQTRSKGRQLMMEGLQRQQCDSSVMLQPDENPLSFHTFFCLVASVRTHRKAVTVLQRLPLPLLGRSYQVFFARNISAQRNTHRDKISLCTSHRHA